MPITQSLRHCSNKYKLAREGEKEKDEDLESLFLFLFLFFIPFSIIFIHFTPGSKGNCMCNLQFVLYLHPYNDTIYIMHNLPVNSQNNINKILKNIQE